MNCSRVREAFLDHEELPRAELAEHLASCEQCRELYAGNAELGRALAAEAALPALALDDLFAGLEARVEHESGLRAWLRSRPSALRFQLAALAVAVVAFAGGVLRLRADWSQYPGPRLLVPLLYLGLVLIVMRQELSARRRLVAAQPWPWLALLALPFVLALAPATEASRHAGPAGALSCFIYGVLLTLPVALLLWALDRDDRPSLRTAVQSAVALGLSANVVLELHCANGNLGHLLLGHVSIGLAWSAAWLLTRQLSRA